MDPAANPDQPNVSLLASLKLTPREAEVLFWISRGKSNRDIGVILGARTGTICKHVEHIFGKLNVENRTAAAVVALEVCRSAAAQPESRRGQPWPMVAGVIATHIAEIWSGFCEICDTLPSLAA
jgi:DNA-binding CsgD family transcriptional regulator